MYVPCLKARMAEREALTNAHVANAPMLPLVEMVVQEATSAPARGVASEILYTFEWLQTAWPRPFLADVRLLADTPAARRDAWSLVGFWASRHPALVAVPCVNPEDDVTVLTAAAGAAAVCQRAALRVEVRPDLTPATLATALQSAVRALDLAPKRVDLILDWRDTPATAALDALEQRTRVLLTAAGGGWRAVTVLGTAAGTNPATDGLSPRLRREWGLWLRLVHAGGLPQDPSFGDYAGFPAPAPGNGRGRVATLRYSAGNVLSIWRYHDDLATGQNGLQQCCAALHAGGVFHGAMFSAGDASVERVLTGANTSPGNGTTWRTIALQHHLALVPHQLAGPLPPPPSPGTP